MTRSFKVRNPELTAIRKTATGWSIKAKAGDEHFSGTVDARGRIATIRRLKEPC